MILKQEEPERNHEQIKKPAYDRSVAVTLLQLANINTIYRILFCDFQMDSLETQDVQNGFKNGTIVSVLPSQNESKKHLYDVVRRLARKSSNHIIPHFYWCSICESVSNINTSTHYPKLDRHFNKCTKNQIEGLCISLHLTLYISVSI